MFIQFDTDLSNIILRLFIPKQFDVNISCWFLKIVKNLEVPECKQRDAGCRNVTQRHPACRLCRANLAQDRKEPNDFENSKCLQEMAEHFKDRDFGGFILKKFNLVNSFEG